MVTDLEVHGFARAPESTAFEFSGPDCIDNDGLIESWTTTPTKMPEGVQPLASREWGHELTKVGDCQIVADTWGAYLPRD